VRPEIGREYEHQIAWVIIQELCGEDGQCRWKEGTALELNHNGSFAAVLMFASGPHLGFENSVLKLMRTKCGAQTMRSNLRGPIVTKDVTDLAKPLLSGLVL
jgi:hypothetical protein